MSNRQMLTFETLPKDIRDAIYELCLVSDKDIIPCPHPHEREAHKKTSSSNNSGSTRFSIPGLLQVNHCIAEETVPIFFGRNTFRLSRTPDYDDEEFWGYYATWFKHVNVVFDVRDISDAKLMEVTRSTITKTRASNRKQIFLVEDTSPEGVKKMRIARPQMLEFDDPKRIKEDVHDERLALLNEPFWTKLSLLAGMDLMTLKIDVGNLTCPGGCCRRLVLAGLCEGFAKRNGFPCLGDMMDLQENQTSARPEALDDQEQHRQPRVIIEGLWDDTEEAIFMKRHAPEEQNGN